MMSIACHTRFTLPFALSLLALGLAACAPGQDAAAPAGEASTVTKGVVSNPDETPSADIKLAVQEVATGLAFPWGAAFLPDGRLLVTEKDGRLRVIENGVLNPTPISGVPPVLAEGQGGLFDVAPHPNFAENNLIYLSFAAGTSRANRTTVIKARLDGMALADVTTVFQANPAKRGNAHFGGRLLFLPDNTLMLTLGDGYSERDQAQNLANHYGKIIRMTDQGTPVPGANAFAGADANPLVHSYGHRNVQGLVRDPVGGAIYAHEHGPKGGDEINLITPGTNYGWPLITYGVDYSGLPISLDTEKDGMAQPLLAWVPSIAPAGMVFYTGDMFPQWKGDLIVSLLAGQHLRRIDLDNGQIRGQETMLSDRAERYRTVIQAPDGALIAITDADNGKVLRITPAQ
jgi:aldose sugar dehydrogenase